MEFKSVKIAKIESVGNRQCKDVTMPGLGNFLVKAPGSNGAFVVHNSKGMAAMCRGVGITCFEDIININGLYRPGPLRAGFAAQYSDRKKSPELVKYAHPVMKAVTEQTYGLILYQEQIMMIFAQLAGFLLKDTDKIRKLISKSKGKEVFNVHRKQFIDGAVKNGMDGEEADKLFNAMYQFGAFSFNKSHCVAYSMLSMKTAWLKKFYPYEFFTALITRVSDDKKLADVFSNMRLWGIPILPPDVNVSKKDFSLEHRTWESNGSANGNVIRIPVKKVEDYLPGSEKYIGIRCGMVKVKFVGDALCDNVIKNAPFTSLEDFLVRVPRSNKRAVDNMIVCGFFDSVHKNRKATMENFLRLREIKNLKQAWEYGIRFFDNTKRMRKKVVEFYNGRRGVDVSEQTLEGMKAISLAWKEIDWTADEKERLVADIYPVLLRKHPIDYFKEELKKVKFKNFCMLDIAKNVREAVGKGGRKTDSGGFRFEQRYMCSIVSVDTLHFGHWGDWLAVKPTAKQMDEAKSTGDSALAGVEKYDWWATWLKISSIDKDGTSAYCAMKPDIFAVHEYMLKDISSGVPFIMFYRIMNVSERLDIKEILPLAWLKKMIDGEADVTPFCRQLFDGTLKIDIGRNGKELMQVSNSNRKKWGRRRGNWGRKKART